MARKKMGIFKKTGEVMLSGCIGGACTGDAGTACRGGQGTARSASPTKGPVFQDAHAAGYAPEAFLPPAGRVNERR